MLKEVFVRWWQWLRLPCAEQPACHLLSVIYIKYHIFILLHFEMQHKVCNRSTIIAFRKLYYQ